MCCWHKLQFNGTQNKVWQPLWGRKIHGRKCSRVFSNEKIRVPCTGTVAKIKKLTRAKFHWAGRKMFSKYEIQHWDEKTLLSHFKYNHFGKFWFNSDINVLYKTLARLKFTDKQTKPYSKPTKVLTKLKRVKKSHRRPKWPIADACSHMSDSPNDLNPHRIHLEWSHLILQSRLASKRRNPCRKRTLQELNYKPNWSGAAVSIQQSLAYLSLRPGQQRRAHWGSRWSSHPCGDTDQWVFCRALCVIREQSSCSSEAGTVLSKVHIRSAPCKNDEGSHTF